jgi:hypothetical protein
MNFIPTEREAAALKRLERLAIKAALPIHYNRQKAIDCPYCEAGINAMEIKRQVNAAEKCRDMTAGEDSAYHRGYIRAMVEVLEMMGEGGNLD